MHDDSDEASWSSSEHASSELAQSYLRSLEIAGDSTVSPARDITQVWIPEYVELGHPARPAPHTLGSPRIRPHAPPHKLPHMLPHTLSFTHTSASASARLPISPRIRRALHASASSGCTPTAAYATEYSTACATASASVCAQVVKGCAREGTAATYDAHYEHLREHNQSAPSSASRLVHQQQHHHNQQQQQQSRFSSSSSSSSSSLTAVRGMSSEREVERQVAV